MSKSFSPRIALLLATALLAGSPAVSHTARVNGWGVPLTDVTADPAIRYDLLPNGMKYAIMRNAVPALARQYLVDPRLQRARVVSDKLNVASAAPVAATGY